MPIQPAQQKRNFFYDDVMQRLEDDDHNWPGDFFLGSVMTRRQLQRKHRAPTIAREKAAYDEHLKKYAL